ncbi:hypothetical protein E3P99_03943 [Wallemia hederae]|uniref:Vta1/callose synthase N-terminal domain-containing protein n=1 Tax=Wallemia hederae TaxID=1540922 RepID=A0A4T0FFW5_9BASI|nr:hypothetical protein E3P99_03943 [Wallemia hederae]
MTLPQELKNLEPYLTRAKELASVEPAIAYWCKFYVLQNALQQKPGKEGERYLLGLMTELEDTKKRLSGNEDLKDLVTDEDAANAYIENFALRVFIKADDLDRAGTINKLVLPCYHISSNNTHAPYVRTVAQTFLASSYFLSLLTLFKNPPGDLHQKIKYARFKTTQSVVLDYECGQDATASTRFCVAKSQHLRFTKNRNNGSSSLLLTKDISSNPPTIEFSQTYSYGAACAFAITQTFPTAIPCSTSFTKKGTSVSAFTQALPSHFPALFSAGDFDCKLTTISNTDTIARFTQESS